MLKKQLVILCYDFPVRNKTAEANLLEFQLTVFKDIFEEIHIIPTATIKAKKIIAGHQHTLAHDFRVFKIKSIINIIKNLKILVDDFRKIQWNNHFINTFIESLVSYIKGIHSYSFLEYYFFKKNINLDGLIVYSFWFNDYSLGALLLKKKNPNISVISGGHGYDLFEDRHKGGRIAFREKSISLINYVYVCSKEGLNYLQIKYPHYHQKFILLNTGIKRKKFKIKPSTDGIFRIISLSRTHPVKRIPYLLQKLKEIENHSKFEIEYFHIGGGIEFQSLKEYLNKLDFKKFKINLTGVISDEALEIFFKSTRIDAFLNVSSSEGTSLSLVEAISYSLPVIVSRVGGNISIGYSCGILLPTNFDSKELYNSFKKIYNNNDYREKIRSNSHQYWSINHDQEKVKKEIKSLFNIG